jgi:hypothetical protein
MFRDFPKPGARSKRLARQLARRVRFCANPTALAACFIAVGVADISTEQSRKRPAKPLTLRRYWPLRTNPCLSSDSGHAYGAPLHVCYDPRSLGRGRGPCPVTAKRVGTHAKRGDAQGSIMMAGMPGSTYPITRADG